MPLLTEGCSSLVLCHDFSPKLSFSQGLTCQQTAEAWENDRILHLSSPAPLLDCWSMCRHNLHLPGRTHPAFTKMPAVDRYLSSISNPQLRIQRLHVGPRVRGGAIVKCFAAEPKPESLDTSVRGAAPLERLWRGQVRLSLQISCQDRQLDKFALIPAFPCLVEGELGQGGCVVFVLGAWALNQKYSRGRERGEGPLDLTIFLRIGALAASVS
jgi:hypothetical protein